MSLHAYLNFKGNAKEAMDYYAEMLQTNAPDIMYFKDMPEDPKNPMPKEINDWVMHGSIDYEGQLIMFSDVMPGMSLNVGNNLSLLIDKDDLDALKAVFDRFAKESTITMPFGETFWAKGFGALTDKFGVEWQFNCSQTE